MDEAFGEGHTVDEFLLVIFRLIALFGLIILNRSHNVSISKDFSYQSTSNFYGGIIK